MGDQKQDVKVHFYSKVVKEYQLKVQIFLSFVYSESVCAERDSIS